MPVTLLKKYLRRPLFLLFLFLLIGIFFRVYRSYEWMLYGHDQELAAWIVKDIVVDGHLRLIGQETSITGLFIGGLYYYAQIPFYLLFKMHPIGSMPVPIIVSALTILSIYFVFKKLYSVKTALFSVLFYAISINLIWQDRWSVPTQPTVLWSVWFLYVLFSLGRGDFKVLPILFILISLIWHIHIAFVPLLLLIPIAVSLAKKNILKEIFRLNKTVVILSIVVSAVFLLPLFIFEIRHGFQQFFALIQASNEERGAYSGLMRSYLILQNLAMTFLFPFIFKLIPINYQFSFVDLIRSVGILGLFSGIGWVIIRNKWLEKKDGMLILFWIAFVFFGQFFTKRAISEYYFYNLLPLPILIISLLFSELSKLKLYKIFVVGFLIIYALGNFIYFVRKPIPQREYYFIDQTLQFIRADAVKNNYQCFGLNFFGEPGVGVGFRYPVWFYKVPVVRASGDIPNYNIAIPYKSGGKEVNAVFGDFGVILPERNKEYDFSSCDDLDRQLLDPNGFVK